MSEQNQMAISPVTAGLAGAATGALAGGFIKAVQPIQSDFKDTKNLLTMDKDKFERITRPADDAAAEVKDNFKIIEEGRKKISEAGDAFENSTVKPARTEYEQALNGQYGAESEFADGTFKKGEKTIAELKQAVQDAEGKVKIDDDADVKKAQQALDDAKGKVDVSAEKTELTNLKNQLAAETDDTKKATLQSQIDAKQTEIDTKIANDAKVKEQTAALDKAKKAALEKNSDVSNARKALKEAEAERFTKMEDKLKAAAESETDKKGPLNTLLEKVKKAKENMGKKFDAAKEADELLKDSKYNTAAEKIKGLLPRAKMKAALIGAAALAALGVAASFIIGPKNPTPTDVA